jgi:hypothetical protein
MDRRRHCQACIDAPGAEPPFDSALGKDLHDQPQHPRVSRRAIAFGDDDPRRWRRGQRRGEFLETGPADLVVAERENRRSVPCSGGCCSARSKVVTPSTGGMTGCTACPAPDCGSARHTMKPTAASMRTGTESMAVQY